MSAGTVYTEIDLDSKRFDAAQKRILYDAKTMAVNVEDSWKVLGQKSDVMYNAMRQQATNAYEGIKSRATSSAAERVRAEEAMHAKIKTLNQQQFGDQVSIINALKTHWMAASAAILGTYYTIKKAYDLAERGVKLGALEQSFASMTRNFNVAGDALLKELEKVTKGTIDTTDLMTKALRLISEGFSEKQIIGIGEAARVSTRLTGKTVSEAYEQISDSLINLRERGLKTAGIIIDMDKAEKQHAATLGVGKEQLSDYGRRMAWAGAIMEKTKEDAAKLGDSLDKLNEYEKFQKWGATWKEFGDMMAKFAASIGEKIIPETTKLFNTLLKSMELIERIGKGENIPEAISKTLGNREEFLKAREQLGWLKPEEVAELAGLRIKTMPTMPGGMAEGPSRESQIKAVDQIELQKKLNELMKQGMALEFQTFEQKIKILDIDRESSIQELKKVGLGQLSYKVWENYWKAVENAEKEESDRLHKLNVEIAKDWASTAEEVDTEWGKTRIFDPEKAGVPSISPDIWMKKWENEFPEYERQILMDIGRLMSEASYEIETEWGKTRMFDPEKAGVSFVAGYMEIAGKLQKIIDPAKQREILDLNLRYAELTGTLQNEVVVYKALIEEELRHAKVMEKAGDVLPGYTAALEKLRMAELARKEAIANLNVSQLMQQGLLDATKKTQGELANQYSSFLPNSIDVMTNAIRESDGSFKSFFDNVKKGFMKMIEDIGFTILKLEILKALGISGTLGQVTTATGTGNLLNWQLAERTGGAERGAGGIIGGGNFLGLLGLGGILKTIGTASVIGTLYLAIVKPISAYLGGLIAGERKGIFTEIGSYFGILGGVIGGFIDKLIGGATKAQMGRESVFLVRQQMFKALGEMGFEYPKLGKPRITELGNVRIDWDIKAIKEMGGLFGFKEFTKKAREAIQQIAQDIYNDVTSTLSDAVVAGLKMGTAQSGFKVFERTLKESIYNSILDGMVEAFVQSTVLQKALIPLYQYITQSITTALEKGFVAATFEKELMEKYAAVQPAISIFEQMWSAIFELNKRLESTMTGSTRGNITVPYIPEGQTGIPYVPYTGIYKLHKGEEVIPPGKKSESGNVQPLTVNQYMGGVTLGNGMDVSLVGHKLGKMIWWATKKPLVFG